jgi:hypothetical protein
MYETEDSYSKATTQFNKKFGSDWQRHIHPQDRDEMCAYLIRMFADSSWPVFSVWNSITNRPTGIDRIKDSVKILVKSQSGRNYVIECRTKD